AELNLSERVKDHELVPAAQAESMPALEPEEIDRTHDHVADDGDSSLAFVARSPWSVGCDADVNIVATGADEFAGCLYAAPAAGSANRGHAHCGEKGGEPCAVTAGADEW